MARVLDTVTMPIKKNGTKTPQVYINNPKSTAPQFSALVAYAAGQIVFYEKKLYRFKTAHPAGAWNAAHVEEITVASELNAHGADLNQLKADLAQVETGVKSAYIYDTASGTIASFDDGADGVPVKDLVVDIEPVQDLHGQDNPYPGGGGKNLLAVTLETRTVAGVTATVKSDGSISLNGTSTDIIYLIINDNLDTTALAGKKFKTNYVSGVSYRITSASSTEAIQSLSSDGTEATITDNGSGLRLVMRINNGVALSNTAVSPRIGVDSTAVASWTPYSNICPISGWTGANVVRTGKNLGDFTDIDSPKTANTQFSLFNLTGTVYVLSFDIVGAVRGTTSNTDVIRIRCADGTDVYGDLNNIKRVSDDVTLGNSTWPVTGRYYIKVAKAISWISFYWRSNSYLQLSAGTCKNIMLESGTTATAYEPSNVNSYSIDWTDEAGTVYGGTLDVTSGVLTVDRARIDLGSLTYTYRDSNLMFSAPLTGYKKTNDNNTVPNIISEMFNTISVSSMIGGASDDNSITVGRTNTWDNYLLIRDKTYTDETTFKTFLNGTYLVYELATPVTYQLTPQEVSTLLGLNNIWADCGDVEVEYRADTKLYIEKLTAPTEDDMIANTNIPDATYFMVGNTLYLSTTTIPAGDTINPGTNCTLMNLASALNALNS